MTIKIEEAKRYGSSITLPLTSFLELGKHYLIQDVIEEIDGKPTKRIIMTEVDTKSILYHLEKQTKHLNITEDEFEKIQEK